MLQLLLDDLRAYFKGKSVLSDNEKSLLQRLQDDIYPVLYLERDDLSRMGFDVSRITAEQIRSLAKKLRSAYCDCTSSNGERFWEDMDSMAQDLNLPRHPICPHCGYYRSVYDDRYGLLYCERCELQWHPDFYVLVESAEDISFFKDTDMGYPSIKNNGNSFYVSEYAYIKQVGCEPDDTNYWEAVRWPKSRPYLPLSGKNDDAFHEPIIDKKGIEAFGEQSVWVKLKKCSD